LELAFADQDIRALCLNPSVAKDLLGEIGSDKLQRRLADMAAVAVVSELFELPGRPTEYPEQPGNMVVKLIDGWQLFFKSSHIKMRTLSTGAVDWTRVRRIMILKVEKCL
jgi:hypothetical protein